MTNPTKSTAGLLTALGEDIRVFRHGVSGRWRGAAQRLRRRWSGGEPENSVAVTKPDTKPKPSLLALLEDDIRQSLGALSAGLTHSPGQGRAATRAAPGRRSYDKCIS